MILNNILSRDLLIDAYKFHSRGDARAHDAIKIIIDRDEMAAAVQSCLSEAKREDELSKQKLYVQAACYGKKSYPGIVVDEYQEACRYIRVANICREKNLDIDAGIPTVIDQLIEREEFPLALWIVRWLKVEGDKRIVESWCEHIISRRTLRDDQVAVMIQKILGENPVVPYADVGNRAIKHNRIPLAITLIENEGQSSKQIPLLLDIQQYDLVLVRALKTCDSNLIYMVIFKLQNKLPSVIQFIELLKKHKLAFKYYCNFLMYTNIQELINISYSNNPQEELTLYLTDNQITSALAASKKSKREFISGQLETRLRLDKFHSSLKNVKAPPLANQAAWNGLSISDTIINLVALGQLNKARDCQKRFDVSDRKYRILEQIGTDTLPKLTVPTTT